MDVVLQYEHISKTYSGWLQRRSVQALGDFSLQVERGEIFGFLGPNGAGKTTAIHLAMGFMRPTSGRGHMLGRPFGDARTRRRVGFLAENVVLYHRPAERLVHFYGALNGMLDPQLRRRTREVLHLLNLTSERNRNAGKFSRGMLQRLGMAQTLVNDPELLILDEPTSALDPAGRVEIRELLLSARTAGKTVFLSSHLLSEVELICDRVAILNRGSIARLGRTAELLESHNQSEIVFRPARRGEPELQKLVVRSDTLRSVLEYLWEHGAEVVRVNPVRRTLEDIFLELTADGAGHAQSPQRANTGPAGDPDQSPHRAAAGERNGTAS